MILDCGSEDSTDSNYMFEKSLVFCLTLIQEIDPSGSVNTQILSGFHIMLGIQVRYH